MIRRNLTQITADAKKLCCWMQVGADGQFRYANSRWFATALERLKLSGVHGMAIDVWVSCSCPTLPPFANALQPWPQLSFLQAACGQCLEDLINSYMSDQSPRSLID